MVIDRRPDADLMVAYRAYFVRTEPRERGSRLRTSSWPKTVLLFDTETSIDPTQRLNFGAFAYARWKKARLVIAWSGLLYADDLPNRDPQGFATIEAFVRDRAQRDGEGCLLFSRREFVEKVLWKAYQAGALICGFNLPFDMSRIAIDCGEGRGFYYGGFSIPIWDYLDANGERRWNQYRPRFNAKPIDSKRAFLGLSGTKMPQVGMHADDVRGHLLDLRTLTFALTDASHSLRSACEAFNTEITKRDVEEHGVITPEYIEYNVQDVRASLSLLERLAVEFNQHPIDLDPTKALSPAAVAKAYLRAMNVIPPSIKFKDLPPEHLGHAMTAYYGGRAECRIRHRIVPIVMLDVLSMYPTVNTLFGNWDVLTAEHLDIEDTTEAVRAMLAAVTPEQVFDPAFWRELKGFAELDADEDVVPIRARFGYNDAFSIGVNHLESGRAWYAIPDLVASKLLTGRTPKIARAFRIVPRGKHAGLKAVALAGRIVIDPAKDDFFKFVIERRKQSEIDLSLTLVERERVPRFLKTVANSGGYGVAAEINPETLPVGQTASMRLFGLREPFDVQTHWPEDGGEFFCPPLASLITSGARLVLALLERCVTDRGGTYAFCDTDSMAIVATEAGGDVLNGGSAAPIRALSFEDVAAIVGRFEQLNPYDKAAVPGSILKVEKENFAAHDRKERRQLYALVISAKRYVLFNEDDAGTIAIRKASEHGLGHLLDPLPDEKAERPGARRWIDETWHYLIDRVHGRRRRAPKWFKLPAVTRVGITTPELLERFGGKRSDRWYADRVKPFNFLLSAHVMPFGQPVDPTTGEVFDSATFHLMAPFTANPGEWLNACWIDRGTGQHVTIATTSNLADANVACVQSYGDVVERYWLHPESKSAATDGSLCDALTSGVLQRRRVRRAQFVYVSKEARKLEEVQSGQVHRWDDVQDVFLDEESEWLDVLLPSLQSLSRARAASLLGVSERAVTELRQNRSRPSAATRTALRAWAVENANRRR